MSEPPVLIALGVAFARTQAKKRDALAGTSPQASARLASPSMKRAISSSRRTAPPGWSGPTPSPGDISSLCPRELAGAKSSRGFIVPGTICCALGQSGAIWASQGRCDAARLPPRVHVSVDRRRGLGWCTVAGELGCLSTRSTEFQTFATA